MRQIVLDTETTGLSPEAGDRIIEIGCVELLNRKLTGHNFHHYLNPDRDIHEDAMKVHGISTDFLSDKPRFENIVEEFLAYVQGAEIIIHNAPFDVGFLNAELQRTGKPVFKEHVNGVLDTLAMAKELYPGKRNSLDALCERLGVSNAARKFHGGLLDAELLADVYIHLTRGQDALLIDADEAANNGTDQVRMDYSAFKLPVIRATAEEMAAHEKLLDEIDKASNGKTVWRQAADQSVA
jgi:DNA polymerase-3 subunit epsilon